MNSHLTATTKTDVIRYGMVGGGEGSFIGDVHRKAIGLVGGAELVCGCFDIDQENNLSSGLKYGVPEQRIYENYNEMACAEASRPDKMDFVIIVTPNNLHYPVSKVFLEKGFHVVCEKPLCFQIEEVRELKKIADEKNLLFGLTYAYIGYPMVKQARQLVRNGSIGEIVEVVAEYAQDWLAELCQRDNADMTIWRNNPEIMGKSGCVADIGTHIDRTVNYITGLRMKSVCTNLRKAGTGVNLDSIGEILVSYENGASGVYWCSQMAFGHHNGLKIRIIGTKGALEWAQEEPCILIVSHAGEPSVRLVQGKDHLDPDVRRFCRLPAGHPEGFYEAFANIYLAYMSHLRIKNANGQDDDCMEYIGISEGVDSVLFVEKCLVSSENQTRWTDL